MLKNLHSLRSPAGARLAAAAALFACLVFLRTRGISENFWLLGDQIRDWQFALGPWRELPAAGAYSSAGGANLGPVYYWALWGVRLAVGPWAGNLPHSGGIGLAVMHSAADAFLLLAVWRRFRSVALALWVALLAATGPFNLALSATIWNPPLAEALVKCSIAAVLWPGARLGPGWQAAATCLAWLAVQAHASAIFFAAPVIASFALREIVAQRWRAAARSVLLAAGVVLVLQVPYLLERLLGGGPASTPRLVVESVAYTLAHPSSLRPVESLRAVSAALEFILAGPWTVAWPSALLACCLVVAAVKERRDLPVVAASAAPVVLAVAGFSFWQRPFDHYWFLTLAPSAALATGIAATAWRPAAGPVAAVLAAIVLLAQPARAADAQRYHRLAEYGPLVRGSREIRQRAATVRDIQVLFPLPASTDPHFIYHVLGGRLSPAARFDAFIHPSGHASFRPASAEGQ